MRTLWQKLQDIGILKRSEQPEIAAEASRFKSDQAFQQYMDTARFNIICQLHALDVDDIDGFQKLKRCQQALDGFTDYMEAAIVSEMMQSRRQA